MTKILLTTALVMFAGYVTGKIFKGFNPLLVPVGILFLLYLAPMFEESEYEYLTYALFTMGIILNFDQPVTRFKKWLNSLREIFSLHAIKAAYIKNIAELKDKAEAELEEKKRKIEEELRRQQEEIRREKEKLKREQERAKAEQQRREQQERSRQQQNRSQQSGKQQSHSQNGQNNSQSRHSTSGNSQSRQSTNGDTSHLDPKEFADACEILGKGQGCSKAVYKAAYKKLINQYHPDKVFAKTGSQTEKAKAEQKTKQLNVAWETIQNKLR